MDWLNSLVNGSAITGTVFLIIGIAGGVLLLLSLALDGIFDALDFGDGPLSLTTISAFATIFGFTSFACVGAGLGVGLAALSGALAGVVGGALSWWLTRAIQRAASSTAVSTGSLVGEQAVVVLGIPAGAGVGEVSLVRHGERLTLTASSDEEQATGTTVQVQHIMSPTHVRVIRLPAPHNHSEAPQEPASPSPERREPGEGPLD